MHRGLSQKGCAGGQGVHGRFLNGGPLRQTQPLVASVSRFCEPPISWKNMLAGCDSLAPRKRADAKCSAFLSNLLQLK